MNRDRTTVNPLLNTPRDLFISSPFEGEGGFIDRRGLFHSKTTMVSFLHKKAQVQEVLGHRADDQNQIRTSSW